MARSATRWKVVCLWCIWALLMVGYQAYVRARFDLDRPDHALFWTANETRAHSQDDKPYLMDPFLNDHVSWDSEYYLSIALAGYDDPQMRAIPSTYDWDRPQVGLKANHPDWVSMNYAFFPFYPLVMRVFLVPLRLLGLRPLAAATLAGMLVSMLGTLGAMLALYDLVRDRLGEAGGMRAAFYLVIFPAGMFLAQVYTEGLFLGLSFGALALVRRKKWVGAALLAACATWTRAAGALLLLPLLWYWWHDGNWETLRWGFSWPAVGKLLLAGSPLFAYLLWNAVLGEPFHVVESRFFSRGLFLLTQSLAAWGYALQEMLGGNPQARAYYLVEFAAIAFGLLACVLMWKRDRPLALYSLVTLFFSLTSGGAQGMHRYVMAAPVLWMVPARWGENPVFDRTWTLGNVLLMGVLAAAFSFDFWAG